MSKQKNILVATHPRSGTHFCINSLCLNLNGVKFAPIRNQYPSIERLILDHDEAYTDAWEAYLNDDSAAVKVFKTHMTPSDISFALNNPHVLNPRDKQLFQEVCENSQIIYLYRDGRDTLVSWYHYLKYSGGGCPIDLPPRIAHCDFSEFMKMPNRSFSPVRGITEADKNRASYWSAHVDEWINRKDVITLSYEDLHQNFDSAITKLATSLKMKDHLSSRLEKPPFIRVAGNNIFGKGIAQARRMLARAYHQHIRGVKHYPPSPAYSRKGIVGNWQDFFNPDDITFFGEFAGNTMLSLGYN